MLSSKRRYASIKEQLVMGRLRQVSRAEASPEIKELYRQFFGDRDPVAQPGTVTGTPGDYWTTFALVPDLLFQARDSLMALMQPGRNLPAKLRELAIIRTGIVGESRFEYSQHLKVARMVGIADDKLGAIKGWATSDKFTDVERAVMQATDELVGRNLVEDETFAALKRHMSDEQIFELFYVIGLWRMHGMIVRALHLEYDKDTTARMIEVPAPEAAKK
jgi:alkylhydroperoxidase family enzyme